MQPNLWPGGRVPYEFDPDLPNRGAVAEAIKLWNSSGVPVELVPREQHAHPDYVRFTTAHACSSRTGRAGGRQDIELSPACTGGVVLHELGHTVGLYHEHTRPDRDEYVSINLLNVFPAALFNFQKQPDRGAEYNPYDFGSIMHYSRMAFSRNRGQTILPAVEPLPTGVLIGQRRELSATDIERLHQLYGQPGPGARNPADSADTASPADPSSPADTADGTGTCVVTGQIVVPEGTPTVDATLVSVRICNVTYSDVPAELVTQCRLIRTVRPDQPINFELALPTAKLCDGSVLNLEVHVDLDGSGHFGPGDLSSLQPHRVVPDSPTVVPVSLVGPVSGLV